MLIKFNRFTALPALLSIGLLLTGCDRDPRVAASLPQPSDIPDRPNFSDIEDTKEKKQRFFNYMYALIERANLEIMTQRIELNDFRESPESSKTQKKIQKLCEEYKASCTDNTLHNIELLLTHIDVVPPALTLAQAANESAWGTSRFAVEANNFFGQWCFTEGCGIVPRSRPSGATHEVRKFDSPMDSVRSYAHNINTSKAYQPLRDLRSKDTTQYVPSSTVLVNGLSKYSERGQDYIDEINHMMKFNKLSQYDSMFGQRLAEAE